MFPFFLSFSMWDSVSSENVIVWFVSLSSPWISQKLLSHWPKKIALAKQYVALNKIFSQNFTQRFHSHIHFVFPLLSLAKNCFCKTVKPSNGKRKPPIMKRFWILGCFFLYLKGTEEKDKEEEGGWRCSWSLFSACLPSFFSRVVSHKHGCGKFKDELIFQIWFTPFLNSGNELHWIEIQNPPSGGKAKWPSQRKMSHLHWFYDYYYYYNYIYNEFTWWTKNNTQWI